MRKPISLFAVVALTGGLLFATAGPAAAVNGRIAFVSGRTGNQTGMFEIWTVSNTGAQPDNVTRSPGAIDVDPAWNPVDGSAIVFARQGENDENFDLHIEAWNGAGAATRVTSGAPSDRQPAWSINGEIAFVRSIRAADTSNIYKVRADGGGLTRLTDTAAPGYDSAPAWSPFGSQVVFVSDRTGTPQLWLMDSGGFTETQLTFESCFPGNPSWSPSGSEIVYECTFPGGGTDLHRISPSAPGVGTAFLADPANDHQPVYSPDGDQILFTRVEPDGNKNLYTVPTAPPTPTPPAPLPGASPQADMSPSWGNQTAPARTTAARPPTLAEREAEGDDARAPEGKKGKKKKKDPRPKKLNVAPGVRYKRSRKAKSDVYVLAVNPDRGPNVDVALSNGRLPDHERVRRTAKRHGAVAGINGDFGSPSTGRPLHTFAEDGDLKQLSFATAWNFAMTVDQQNAYFGRPFETVTAEEHDIWRVERWNFGEPGASDIAAFTSAGGSLEYPPANSCAARLVPQSGPRWGPSNVGLETSYRVEAVGCSTTPMALGSGIVLAAQPGSDGALLLTSLTVGENVDLTWSLGWANVADTVGGTPLLLDNGQIAAKQCGESLCGKHPRTAVGITPTGRILMVVVDGRSKQSAGVTLVKLAQIMKKLKAVYALNLDGGGSSTMVVNGKVMNIPSDGKERPVSSSVLVLTGPDKGQVAIGGRRPAGRTATAPGRVDTAALTDPGSTGGLLEAMAEGTFGAPVPLPREWREALARFRSAQQRA